MELTLQGWLLWNKPPKSDERINAEDAVATAQAKIPALEQNEKTARENFEKAKKELEDIREEIKNKKKEKADKQALLVGETSDPVSAFGGNHHGLRHGRLPGVCGGVG